MSIWYIEVFVNSTIDPGWRIYKNYHYNSKKIAERAIKSVPPQYQEVRVREYRRIEE